MSPLELLERMDAGLEPFTLDGLDATTAARLGVPPGTSPWDTGSPTVVYRARGWAIEVFNDAGSWDYIEAFTAPDGTRAELEVGDPVFEWSPRHRARWGLPPRPSLGSRLCDLAALVRFMRAP